MSPCRNKSFLLLFCVASGLQLKAQTSGSEGSNPLNGTDNNPYSKYGIGELLNGNNTALRGMGNVSTAFANPNLINSENPASYSFIKLTTFELGGTGISRTTHGIINGADQSYRTGTATLAYMSLAVPLKKDGGSGFTIGFRPYSRTYFDLRDTLTGTPTATDSGRVFYKGDGALNHAFLGGSYKIKGVSLGVNVGYLFGNINNDSYIEPFNRTTGNRDYQSWFSSSTRTGGIYWNSGLQWQIKIDSFNTLMIGATASLNQKVKQHYSEYSYARYNFGDTIVRDTMTSLTEVRGSMTMPLSYSAGIMYTRQNKWSIGLDYRATQWSDFGSDLNPNMSIGIAQSAYKLSLGSEYTPNATDIRNFFSRATYRLGGYYGSSYVQLKNTDISYFGATAGITLPFKRHLQQVASMHAAIDYSVLGTTNNGLIKQNALRFTVGLSISTRWFDQYKYQ